MANRDYAADVKRLIQITFDVDEQRIQPQAELIADLGADDLTLVELRMAMEEAFDITISDDAVENILTVRELITYVAKVNSS